jgi:hypothetical protein
MGRLETAAWLLLGVILLGAATSHLPRRARPVREVCGVAGLSVSCAGVVQ